MNKTLVTEESTIRVLKTSKCISLSGRSSLTYVIGCDTEKNISIKITDNSGTGLFSKQWIHIALPDDNPITSGALQSLCNGKSVNTAGFLLAVLIHEGLINVVNEKPRKYEKVDPAEFTKRIQALLDTDILPSEKKKAPKKPESTPQEISA